MKLKEVKLRYSKYVVITPLVKKVVDDILHSKRKDTANRIHMAIELTNWVADNIRTTRGYDRPPYPDETLKTARGTCFAKAILLCSMLRYYGFSSKEVYVVCKMKNPPRFLQELLHAGVVLYEEQDKVKFLNPSSDERVVNLGSLEELNKLAKLYCLFNDKRAFLIID